MLGTELSPLLNFANFLSCFRRMLSAQRVNTKFLPGLWRKRPIFSSGVYFGERFVAVDGSPQTGDNLAPLLRIGPFRLCFR